MWLAWESKSGKKNSKLVENINRDLLWKKGTSKAEGELSFVEVSQYRKQILVLKLCSPLCWTVKK